MFHPPGGHLVVSEEVKSILEESGPCEFLQVEFVKLINSPFCEKGDFSCYRPDDELRTSVDLVDLLDDYPDVPKLHETIGKYYELLLPAIAKLEEEFEDMTQLHISMDGGYIEIDEMVSEEMLTKYPMLSCGPSLFREDVYLAVEEFLDKDFFLVEHVDL